MAGADGFKHISVTPDEDEDVVILAGAKKPDARMPEDRSSSACVDMGTEAPGSAQAGSSDESSDGAEGLKQARAPKPQKPKARPVSKKDDGYHETTLEDLQSAPMSTMQKAIIVFAVAAIVIAIAYYMMFMR